MTNDYDVRVQCLELAVAHTEAGARPSQVVSCAQTFYNFLMPQKAPLKVIPGGKND